jgi:acyl phosphate:glycerol-3-phosphate acyltransferase
MIEAALILGAYLVGAIPFGVLIARRYGVDLFKVGSGNVGATNVSRALGKGPAILVFALDLAKGLAPAWLAREVFASPEWAFGVGAAAIAGHCLSPFLRFRGGKGIATALGVVLGTTPLVALSSFGVFLVVFAISRWVSVASIVAVASTLLFGYLFGDSPFMMAMYGLLLTFVIYRHRANIQRLRRGEEPKFQSKRRKNEDSDEDMSNRKDMSAGSQTGQPSSTSYRWEGGPRA